MTLRPKRREIREATVLAVQEDRILVDLGAKRDGRVPSADLERLDDEVRDSLQVGAQVPVYVLDPATDHLNLGDVLWGRVTNVVDFGAFVELDDGVEGLVHISEFPQDAQSVGAAQPGSMVQVRVLRIDIDRRRIALSLRDLGQTQTLPLEQAGW